MSKLNYKIIFKWFLRILLFSIFFAVIWFFIRPRLITLLANYIKNVNIITNIMNYSWGVFDLIISALISLEIENIFQKKPKVYISPMDNMGCNMSGIRRMNDLDTKLCVKIGTSSLSFRIVYAEIKNIGNKIISECYINGQNVNICLAPNQSSKLYFIIYEQIDSLSKFIIPFCIRDDENYIYRGKYCILIDYQNSKALFRVNKRIKRSIL